MRDSTLGELSPSRRAQPALEGQPWVSCCSDANRIAAIVASIRGRAKLGLQVRSLRNKRILRLNLGRWLVFLVEEVVEVEVVNAAVVVASHMIKVKSEGVGDRIDPVFKEVTIRLSGLRSAEEAAEVMLRSIVTANI